MIRNIFDPRTISIDDLKQNVSNELKYVNNCEIDIDIKDTYSKRNIVGEKSLQKIHPEDIDMMKEISDKSIYTVDSVNGECIESTINDIINETCKYKLEKYEDNDKYYSQTKNKNQCCVIS